MMTMAKFYFTYGSDEKFPYQYGWTEIEAPDIDTAIAAFRIYHPDRHQNTINCSFWYTEERFKKSNMAEIKIPGNFCHERITVTREVIG